MKNYKNNKNEIDKAQFCNVYLVFLFCLNRQFTLSFIYLFFSDYDQVNSRYSLYALVAIPNSYIALASELSVTLIYALAE